MCCILVKIIDYSLECRLLAAAASLLVREEKRGRGKEIVLVTLASPNSDRILTGTARDFLMARVSKLLRPLMGCGL